ncbi:MAG TPA: SRPBCC domain-containing protein [Kofleriaceae bacterium]|jgi:uncharacterized protein YndB with AHSA1/START domain
MNETKLTVPTDRPVILIERWFDAPRHLVWKATTTPDLVKRWYMPACVEMLSCEIDLRVGGAWRIGIRSPEFGATAMYGEFRTIEAPERMVRTYIFQPFPEAVAIETSVLVAEGARTKLELEIAHGSFAARDGHVGSGMEAGMRQAHDQLEAVARAL